MVYLTHALIFYHAYCSVYDSLVGKARREVVREIHRDTVNCAKRVPLFLYPVCREAEFLLVLENH